MAQMVKNLLANAGDSGDEGSIPGPGEIPWRRTWQPAPVLLPWTEEPGGLQAMGSQKSWI